MKNITKRIILILGVFCLLSIFASLSFGQQTFYNYEYKLDLTGATEAPKLGGTPNIDIPKKATKEGVEGTLKAVMTLAKDGIVKDFVFEQSLPHGVEQAVMDAYKNFKFKPATRNGTPVDVKLYMEYTISVVYSERSKGVKKPKITNQPKAVYPAEEMKDKRKGEVLVGVLFNKDGTTKVLGVQSTMPRAFDKAAMEAAKKIKFTPATHKKSKKNVSMQMTVKYKFKP